MWLSSRASTCREIYAGCGPLTVRPAVPAGSVRRMRHALVALAAIAVATGGAPAAEAARGALDVEQRFDYSAGVYFEGSVSYLRVRKGRRVVAERSRTGPVSLVRRLPPGLYRVASYQRPCAGNCTFLDMPTD